MLRQKLWAADYDKQGSEVCSIVNISGIDKSRKQAHRKDLRLSAKHRRPSLACLEHLLAPNLSYQLSFRCSRDLELLQLGPGLGAV